MTIKPLKSDNNESEGTSQHSPNSPATQHVIDQRNNLRNAAYSVDEVVGVNRHRRNNQKSGTSHSSLNSGNAQKHHKQRNVNINSCGGSGSGVGVGPSNSCTNDPSQNVGDNENELLGPGGSGSIAANASNIICPLSSIQSTSSNVIINNCIIGNTNLNNSNNNNTNCNNSTVVNHSLMKKSPLNVVNNSNDNVNDDEQNSYSGYNSGDEHIGQKYDLTPEEWGDRDRQFAKTMSDRGFVIEEIAEDGACLFRSISLQIFGDQDMHEIIRQQTMDYIYKNREYFAQFVTEDIDSYVSRKRNNHVHGNHIEIQAISEIYNRPVELYSYESEPANIFNSDQIKIGIDPLRLSYQRGSHYNAILNPYKPTVGLGLGLAGYRIMDESPNVKHMREAVRMSEEQEIEQTMFEDKLKTTDWEATNEAIEEQIARESYLQWCRENHQAQKQKQQLHQQMILPGIQSSSTITSTTVTASLDGSFNYSNKHHAKNRDSDDSGSCGSGDYYQNNLSPDKMHASADDHRDELDNSQLSDGSDSMKSYSKYNSNIQQQYQGRKRRSNRRRTPNNGNNNSNNNNNNSNNSSSSSSSFSNDAASDSISPNDYVHESNQCTDDAGHSKKRRLTNPDVPGPSSCYNKSSPTRNDKPMSDFYHSLLESSYADATNGNLPNVPTTYVIPIPTTTSLTLQQQPNLSLPATYQLSEEEMIHKALQMSRLEFMQK